MELLMESEMSRKRKRATGKGFAYTSPFSSLLSFPLLALVL